MSRHQIRIINPQSDEDSNAGSESYDDAYSSDSLSSSSEALTVPTIDNLELLFPDRIMLLGASESGKTTLIRHIIAKYLRSGRLITNSGHSVFWFGKNAKSERWLPAGHADTEISKTKITGIRNMMKKGFPDKYVIVVLDDILSENFHHDKFYDDLVSTSRHDRLILLIGLQYINNIPPVFRHNIKRVFITHANNKTKRAMYELSSNPNERDFYQSLSNIELGYPALIDLRPGAKVEVQHIKVPPLEKL